MGMYEVKKSIKTVCHRFFKVLSPGLGLSRYFSWVNKGMEWLSYPPRVPQEASAQIKIKDLSFELHVSPKDAKISALIYANKIWEKNVSILFESVLKEGMTVIDLGSHIGYFSILAGMKVRPSGRVFAFEPNRLSYEMLVKNIEQNGLKDIVIPLHKAAANEEAVKILYGDSRNDPSDSFLVKTGKHRIEQEVECVRVGDYLKRHFPESLKRPCVIKMDIEGFEVEACRGMEELLRRPDVTLFTELNYRRLRDSGTSAEAFLDLLTSYGFHIQTVNYHAQGDKDLLVSRSMESLIRNEQPDTHEDLYCVKAKG